MKFSRARGPVRVAAVLGVAAVLAAVSSSAWGASPAVKPAGAAFVHVGGEGQTAHSVKVKATTYKIKAPADAVIDWVGVVEGKGDRSGNYTPKQLAKAWTALGHRTSAGVQSTITWFAAGSETMSFRSAMVSNPRVNSKGELVFTAKLNDGRAAPLPSVLPEFGINISRAQPQQRNYPVNWSVTTITSDFGYTGAALADASGKVAFQDNPGSGWTDCAGATLTPSGASNITLKIPAQVVCGAYTLYTDKTLVNYSLPTGDNNDWEMLPCWHITWGSSSKSTACSWFVMEWGKGGA